MELNFKLHPAQLQIFNSLKRFKIVAAGRRFGKSYLSAIMLLIHGLKLENEHGYDLRDKRVFYIAPTFDQGKRIIWNLLKILGKEVIESTLENQAIIRLINGRMIEIKGADRPDTLRGVGLSFCVMDEYAFMKPEVWDNIIRPTLADVRGDAMFIGTPDGKNHFYDLYLQALQDDEWDAFNFTSFDNPTLDPEEIEKARKTLSSHSFRQEFEAKFEAAGGNIFKEEYIKYSDTEPEDGYWYITVDPAGFADVAHAVTSKLKRLDECAIAAVKVGVDGWYIGEIKYGRWGVQDTSLHILMMAKKYQAMTVGIEKGSLKNAIMPYLMDQMKRIGTFPYIVEVTHGGKKKEERIAWALQGRFEHGQITLKPGDWNARFVEQLLDFPNPMAHDDLIDAVAYIDQIASTIYNYDVVVDNWKPLDAHTGF